MKPISMKVSERFIRMLSKKGFVEVFWETLRREMETNPKITHEECYELLEKEYSEVTGIRRYSNFITTVRLNKK